MHVYVCTYICLLNVLAKISCHTRCMCVQGYTVSLELKNDHYHLDDNHHFNLDSKYRAHSEGERHRRMCVVDCVAVCVATCVAPCALGGSVPPMHVRCRLCCSVCCNVCCSVCCTVRTRRESATDACAL